MSSEPPRRKFTSTGVKRHWYKKEQEKKRMSNGEQQVKRWEPCLKDSPAGTYVTTRQTKRVRDVYVRIEDHDRIVTELHNRLYEYNKETSELRNERSELKAEVERLTGEVVRRNQYRLNQEMLDVAHKVYEEQIARQARVVENIKQALDNPATRPNEALVQIREAIEQQGEGT